MILNGKKVVVLYLEEWQKRMIKDFLGVECDHWEIPIEEVPIYMYGVPSAEKIIYKRMYLTDWQMRELKDEAGITGYFIELKKETAPKYAVPPK
jgi:hypothetical protein